MFDDNIILHLYVYIINIKSNDFQFLIIMLPSPITEEISEIFPKNLNNFLY